MMHVIDFKIRKLRQDHLAISGALFVEIDIGKRREGRLQRSQALYGGLRTRIFLVIQRQRAMLAIDRYNALSKWHPSAG